MTTAKKKDFTLVYLLPGLLLMTVFVTVPVSYTHLDVYKRQAWV